MSSSHTKALERMARVLAGQRLSANAHGHTHSAAHAVDQTWRSHLEDAAALLNALREPDSRMIEVGDADMWTRMVRAALGEDVDALKREQSSWNGAGDTYQKLWG